MPGPRASSLPRLSETIYLPGLRPERSLRSPRTHSPLVPDERSQRDGRISRSYRPRAKSVAVKGTQRSEDVTRPPGLGPAGALRPQLGLASKPEVFKNNIKQPRPGIRALRTVVRLPWSKDVPGSSTQQACIWSGSARVDHYTVSHAAIRGLYLGGFVPKEVLRPVEVPKLHSANAGQITVPAYRRTELCTL